MESLVQRSRQYKVTSVDVLLPSAYLPSVGWFAQLYSHSKVWIEGHDHYQKQTCRNRCVIASPNGVLPLTIPIDRYDTPKCAMRDIRISDHGNWRRLHLNALDSAYRNSPFFEYYIDDFLPFYERKYEFLYDYNRELVELVCRLIGVEREIQCTAGYGETMAVQPLDLRTILANKHYDVPIPGFTPKPYYQTFQQRWGFLPNLSIVDLLFNMGPESILVLRDSVR